MKAYLIDPEARTIEVIEHDDSLNGIYEAIQAPLIDAIRINKIGDVIYVDDEGLYRQPQWFFAYENYPHPIAGRGLVLGTNIETGESREPMIVNSYTLKESIRWITADDAMVMGRLVSQQMKAEALERPGHIVVDTYEIMKGQSYTEKPD